MEENGRKPALDFIERIYFDDETAQRVAQARNLEALLNSRQLSGDDELSRLNRREVAEASLAKMNETCTHISSEVRVSGVVSQAYYDEIDEKIKIETVAVEDYPVVSQGYKALLLGEGENAQIEVGNFFLTSELPGRDDGLVQSVVRTYAFARVGTVTIAQAER